MWFLAGFPAKTFHAPGKAQALTASEADSGQKWRGLLGGTTAICVCGKQPNAR